MSLIDQLLKKGRVPLPSPVGEISNELLKVGSSTVAEVKALNRFLDNFKDLKNNPQANFYILNSLLRELPIRLPDHVRGGEDLNMIRSLLRDKIPSILSNKDHGKGPFVINESRYKDKGSVKLPKDTKPYKKLFPEVGSLNWLSGGESEITPLKGSSAYKGTYDPYDSYIELKFPNEIKEYLNRDNFNFGYKKWAGFEIGTDHLWDISMEPYTEDGGTVFGSFPTYAVPKASRDLLTDDKITFEVFDFGKHLPAISYNLQFGNQIVKQIPLYNGSQFQFPIGFSYDMTMSIDIVDDIYHSMKKYLIQCLNKIYDLNESKVAPFYKAAWIIDLTVYRTGFEKNYRVKLIGCPINYSPVYEGQNEPQETRVNLQLGIVGIVNSESANNIQIGENDWEKSVNWTEVTLNPNGKKAKFGIINGPTNPNNTKDYDDTEKSIYD